MKEQKLQSLIEHELFVRDEREVLSKEESPKRFKKTTKKNGYFNSIVTIVVIWLKQF